MPLDDLLNFAIWACVLFAVLAFVVAVVEDDENYSAITVLLIMTAVCLILLKPYKSAPEYHDDTYCNQRYMCVIITETPVPTEPR